MAAVISSTLACLAACLAVVIDSVLPGGPYLPAAVWIIPMIAAFPLYLVVMMLIKGEWRPRLADAFTLLRPLPMAVRVGVLGLLVAALANTAFLWATGPTGQPEKAPGGYVMNVHGSRTPISEQEYLRAEGTLRRAFALGGAWFHGWFAAATVAARMRRERGEHADEPAQRWPFSESGRHDQLPKL